MDLVSGQDSTVSTGRIVSAVQLAPAIVGKREIMLHQLFRDLRERSWGPSLALMIAVQSLAEIPSLSAISNPAGYSRVRIHSSRYHQTLSPAHLEASGLSRNCRTSAPR